MARSVTLANLLQEIRDRGEFPSTSYPTDAMLTRFVNLAIAEVYDLICSVNQDFYLDSWLINVVSGTDTYALDADFYRVRGVEYLDTDGKYRSMDPFIFEERNLWPYSDSERAVARYRVMGSNIIISPKPAWTATSGIRVWFIPAAPVLATSGSWDGVSGWEEYVVTRCVMMLKAMEESDTSNEKFLLGMLKQRIESAAKTRDASAADYVRDIRLEQRWRNYERLPRP